MAVVRVPKTPKSSFNMDRRPSALLLDQIKHLEWAALPASQRKPKQVKKYPKVRTEAQAAERIKQLTTLVLYNQQQELEGPPPEPGVQRKVVLPPLPKVARGKPLPTRRKKAPARTKAKAKAARGRKARRGRKRP